jgi:cyclopropane fatty-acyl-phospholipid synthase-like methyltransferase
MSSFSYDPAQLERWNKRFSADEYIFGKGPNAFLAAQRARFRPGMRALCVSDGEGRNSVWLASLGLDVTAFDFSPVAIEKARALAREAGVEVDYRLSDIFRWEWTRGAYDAVVVIFTQFMGAAARAPLFAGMQATLRPAGLLVMQGYTPKQLEYATGGPKEVENLYTAALLRESFGAMEILHLAEHEDVVDEGPAHKGMSALVDMVARKR